MPRPSAFSALVAKGHTPAQIAKMFNVREVFVRQILASQKSANIKLPTTRFYAQKALEAVIAREQREIAAKQARIASLKQQIAELR